MDLTTLINIKQYLNEADKPITGVSQANPAVITCPNHNFKTGKQVMLSGIGGMTQLNGQTVTVTVVDLNSFSIGIDSTLYHAYTGAGFVGVDDVLLTRLVTAASAFIQRETGRVLASEQYSESYNGVGSNCLMLRNQPVTAVASVVVDGVTVPPAASSMSVGFLFDDKMVYLNGFFFSRGFQNIQVSYTGGPLAGDPDIALAEEACIELAAWDYRRKDRTGEDMKTTAGQAVHYTVKELPDEIARKIRRLARVTPV